MNIFTLDIWYDEGSVCTFYTVRWDSDEEDMLSESDKFFETYAVSGHSLEEKGLQLLRLITESIGNKYGATNDFFNRIENNAQALPPRPNPRLEEINDLGINFPLRLFCYRVSEHIVVLFNGGIKDGRTVQESSNLNLKFIEAQTFVRRIEGAIRSEMIIISDDDKYLLNFDSTTELIL